MPTSLPFCTFGFTYSAFLAFSMSRIFHHCILCRIFITRDFTSRIFSAPHYTSGFFFVTSLIWKVEIYPQTKFRREISIHDWDIITSGFWNQTSAMLGFYFAFRFSPLHHHQHAILHLFTKYFVQIGPSAVESYRFSRWRPAVSHTEFSQR